MFTQGLVLLICSAFPATSLLIKPTLPAFTAADKTTYCNHTTSITYRDPWGPIFTEHSYHCDFPPSNHDGSDHSTQTPLIVPAPYSSVAGQRGADPQIVSRGTVEPVLTSYQRALLQAHQKLTIPEYGCGLLPHPKKLDDNKYSNLFWAMRQLTNQTCVEPGEAKEFSDVRMPWTADWRFAVVNRGDKIRCEWWQELANVAEALHYVCYFSEIGAGVGERSGGIEALAWGRGQEEGLRWCMRYSERGWGEDLFEEECLGI
jgi:hypothetical protein